MLFCSGGQKNMKIRQNILPFLLFWSARAKYCRSGGKIFCFFGFKKAKYFEFPVSAFFCPPKKQNILLSFLPRGQNILLFLGSAGQNILLFWFSKKQNIWFPQISKYFASRLGRFPKCCRGCNFQPPRLQCVAGVAVFQRASAPQLCGFRDCVLRYVI